MLGKVEENLRRYDELEDDGTDSRRTQVATRRHCVILVSFLSEVPPPTIEPFLKRYEGNQWETSKEESKWN